MLDSMLSKWFISVGDTVIGVEWGLLKGTNVPEQFAKLIVLSPVGLLTPRSVS